MKTTSNALLIFLWVIVSFHSHGQIISCDTIYTRELSKDPTFKNNKTDIFKLFNNELFEIIQEDFTDEYPPESFRMNIVINENDEVISISMLVGNYSDKIKEKLLNKLQENGGWSSGEINGKKVCSEYHFIFGCIKYN